MTHDIISDILTADTIPHDSKGKMIDQQLDKLQDPTRDVMSMDEWRMMAEHMGGIDAMGGPATALVRQVRAPAAPPANVGQMHGAMPGMAADSGHMAHDMGQMDRPMKGMAHDSMPPAGADTARTRPGMDHGEADTAHAATTAHMSQMMDLHARMMADPVIRQRVMADTVLRRLMAEMDSAMAAHRGHMRGATGRPVPEAGGRTEQPREPSGRARPPAKAPASRQAPTTPEPADSARHHAQHSSGPSRERGGRAAWLDGPDAHGGAVAHSASPLEHRARVTFQVALARTPSRAQAQQHRRDRVSRVGRGRE
jgi:hypothetical protein